MRAAGLRSSRSRISRWNGDLYSFTPRGNLPETPEGNNVVVGVQADTGGMQRQRVSRQG